MSNQSLRQEYAKHHLRFRAVGGKRPKYIVSSYEYLPVFPTMTLFSKEAAREVEARVNEFRARFGQPTSVDPVFQSR